MIRVDRDAGRASESEVAGGEKNRVIRGLVVGETFGSSFTRLRPPSTSEHIR